MTEKFWQGNWERHSKKVVWLHKDLKMYSGIKVMCKKGLHKKGNCKSNLAVPVSNTS